MNRTIMAATFALLLAAAPAMAQMTPGYGQHMMQQQQMQQEQMQHHMMQQQQPPPQQQQTPCQTNPGMMGGYGYGMHPGMMGGYGYGMNPQMMGGYGYGMGPQMMGGYGMGQHMMSGYGMHPGMMGGYGYGTGQQMMGGCGMHEPYGEDQESNLKSNEEHGKFLDDTRDMRKKLHNLMFDYSEARRSPESDTEKLQDMEKEMNKLRTEIFSYKTK